MTKIKKANNKQTLGTSGIGYLSANYHDLVQKLGKPHDRTKEGEWESLDNKIKTEWAFSLDKNTIFTIYDYKSQLEPQQNVHWHIGGKGKTTKIIKYFITEFGQDNIEIFKRNN